MQAWFTQNKKQTGPPVSRPVTEGRNDFIQPGVHTVTQSTKLDGPADRPSNPSGAPPQVGLRGIQKLKNKFVDIGFRPEENIRTFEGALEYLFLDLLRTASGGLSGSFSLTREAWF
ncbi:hypothetical protein DQ04_13551010 [Trypanosoma grayi]|uniref:hypothetical protein n=1 Tax=Trypanosoma grayi TaxID=71804 RepID=UPI0004F49839|nr:hypothetical protein DQ04_13551010 [Trypanosoma grayi]KEG06514.1 hypothetical protein DQ04_13551010 [Trypanosoma grayi]